MGMGVAEQVTDILSEVPNQSEEESLPDETGEDTDAKGTMLLVEDNSELRLFLRSILLPNTGLWRL